MRPRGTAGPQQYVFDATPEIFATDSHGAFTFALQQGRRRFFDTTPFDELRLVASIWHPSDQKSVDLDRAYVELRSSFDPEEEHWTRIAEIEPVVPPYNSGEAFDGWIVLPVLAQSTAYCLVGNGFEPRSRLQARVSAYFVA